MGEYSHWISVMNSAGLNNEIADLLTIVAEADLVADTTLGDRLLLSRSGAMRPSITSNGVPGW